uniref:Uncharacterized protein n=1 Tax=Chromera velia CCMP2878 TaxID=1169474 RepID=A0A0G4HLS6_9ALVE|eukprot:Cvel_28874.t1-p1 / transcript=Cvel_28874.t1 / gene=Cvel_28874 / organism=Chromera_velia_CCMP2878 / gene_product=hypothetical protein / transcript_product=hypothetical protein / location=Cvel_scaffold3858:8239-12955(+) / protein_length=516 / sequence_SO=supercontig / SO=protein_coding / is_pseudo=false
MCSVVLASRLAESCPLRCSFSSMSARQRMPVRGKEEHPERLIQLYTQLEESGTWTEQKVRQIAHRVVERKSNMSLRQLGLFFEFFQTFRFVDLEVYRELGSQAVEKFQTEWLHRNRPASSVARLALIRYLQPVIETHVRHSVPLPSGISEALCRAVVDESAQLSLAEAKSLLQICSELREEDLDETPSCPQFFSQVLRRAEKIVQDRRARQRKEEENRKGQGVRKGEDDEDSSRHFLAISFSMGTLMRTSRRIRSTEEGRVALCALRLCFEELSAVMSPLWKGTKGADWEADLGAAVVGAIRLSSSAAHLSLQMEEDPRVSFEGEEEETEDPLSEEEDHEGEGESPQLSLSDSSPYSQGASSSASSFRRLSQSFDVLADELRQKFSSALQEACEKTEQRITRRRQEQKQGSKNSRQMATWHPLYNTALRLLDVFGISTKVDAQIWEEWRVQLLRFGHSLPPRSLRRILRMAVTRETSTIHRGHSLIVSLEAVIAKAEALSKREQLQRGFNSRNKVL